MTSTIRVIVFKEGDMFVAQCLEHDIGAQAADLDTLKKYVEAAIDCEAAESVRVHGQPFMGIEPAPKVYFDAWESRGEAVDDGDVINLGEECEVRLDMALAA